MAFPMPLVVPKSKVLTRAGLVSSVHAFAQSSIGPWFTTLLCIIFAVCLFFYIMNRDHLKSENKLESLVSRESSFLFNNLLLLGAMLAPGAHTVTTALQVMGLAGERHCTN